MSRENRRASAAGFTLLELIVVIVIIAVLAGVGTAAYMGYVRAANKGADRQTVGELIYAATLADYADPSVFRDDGKGIIVLTGGGVIAAGTYDADAFEAGLENALGSLSAISLAYTDWSGALDSAVLRDAMRQIGNIPPTGNSVSYAAQASVLWEAVEETAAAYASGQGGGTPEEYVAKAASYTVESVGTDAAMGSAWASGNVAKAFGDSVLSGASGAAGLAAQLARNYAFAEYLQWTGAQVGSGAVSYLQGGGNVVNLGDYVLLLYESESPPAGTDPSLAADWSVLHGYAVKYCTEENELGYSQAYTDGVAYYDLMYCVHGQTENGTFRTDDPDYLKSIGSYVSTIGSILTMDWESMTGLMDALGEDAGSVVVITAVKSGGLLSFSVRPGEADPRATEPETGGGAACTQHHDETISLTLAMSGGIKVGGGDYVIDGSEAGTVDICTIDPRYAACEISIGDIQPTSMSITEGGEFVTLNGTTLTAVKAGTAVLTVTLNGRSTVYTATVTIHVH